MSIIDTLITDRTQADVTKLRSLLSKPKVMWTNEEWSDFLLAKDKGAYNATDLNRVQEAMEYLAERFRGYGYNVPEIKRPSITEVIPGTSRLPEGYTELEYIRSTGIQYINTGITPSKTLKISVEVGFDSTQSSENGVFGSRNASTLQFWGSLLANQKKFAFKYGSSTTQYTGDADSLDKVSLIATSSAFSVNGNSVAVTTTSYTSTYPVYLFGVNNAGNLQYPATCKIYSCQIYDNEILVRDFVPCLNPSNEVGLYDIVNGVFYGNAGTGYFLPGAAVSLPEGYTRLEYIQSSGTQYINTQFMPNQDSRVVMDFQMVDGSTGEQHLCSARNTSNGPFFIILMHSGYKVRYASQALQTFSNADYERKRIDFNKNVVSMGGETKTFTYSDYQLTVNLPIFCRNTGGTMDCYSSMKLHSYQIYDNDVLTRLYTPALNADGEAGLYDSITGEFYGNSGTGTFVAGNELGSSDGNTPTQIIERDYWVVGDIPSNKQMEVYLNNVRELRKVNAVLSSTPPVPDSADNLTYEDANNIEKIFVDIEYLIGIMTRLWFYSAEVFCGEV